MCPLKSQALLWCTTMAWRFDAWREDIEAGNALDDEEQLQCAAAIEQEAYLSPERTVELLEEFRAAYRYNPDAPLLVG